MMELKRLDVFQTGKVLAALGLLIGIIGFVISLFGTTLSTVTSGAPGRSHFSPLPLMFVVFYPLRGFIYGILIAAFYNFIAQRIGGFRFNLEHTEELPK